MEKFAFAAEAVNQPDMQWVHQKINAVLEPAMIGWEIILGAVVKLYVLKRFTPEVVGRAGGRCARGGNNRRPRTMEGGWVYIKENSWLPVGAKMGEVIKNGRATVFYCRPGGSFHLHLFVNSDEQIRRPSRLNILHYIIHIHTVLTSKTAIRAINDHLMYKRSVT